MTSNTPFSVKDCIIDDVTLINYRGDELSLIEMYNTFEFSADIFSTTVHGMLNLNDSRNLHQNFPIINQEKIRFKLRTDSTLPQIELTMSVYTTLDKVELNDGMYNYSLLFCSKEFLKSKSTLISNSFVNMSPEDIVKTCLEEHMESKIELFAEPSANKINYVAHKQRPMEVCNAMLPRGVSKESDNSAYVFFQGFFGYHFKTVDRLAAKEPLIYTFKKKGYASGSDGLYTIDKYALESNSSSISNLNTGMYGNTVLAFDPITLSVNKSSFDYFNDDDFTKTSTTEGKNPDLRMGTKDFEFQGTLGQFKFVMADDKSSRLSLRTTRLLQVDNGIIVNIEVSGNTGIECGDTVSIEIPSDEQDPDKFISGTFLITSVRHIFEQRKHTTCLRLSKDAFANDHEKYTDTFVKRVGKLGVV